MAENKLTAALADLTRKFALELAFVEVGKDNGLLPLNNFLMEIESSLTASPANLTAAVTAARAWFDHLFDTTAIFDAPMITRLGEWHAWMETALEQWAKESPVPDLPREWQPLAASSAAIEQNSPTRLQTENILPNAN